MVSVLAWPRADQIRSDQIRSVLFIVSLWSLAYMITSCQSTVLFYQPLGPFCAFYTTAFVCAAQVCAVLRRARDHAGHRAAGSGRGAVGGMAANPWVQRLDSRVNFAGP